MGTKTESSNEKDCKCKKEVQIPSQLTTSGISMFYLILDIASLLLIYVMEGPLKISNAEGPPS